MRFGWLTGELRGWRLAMVLACCLPLLGYFLYQRSEEYSARQFAEAQIVKDGLWNYRLVDFGKNTSGRWLARFWSEFDNHAYCLVFDRDGNDWKVIHKIGAAGEDDTK